MFQSSRRFRQIPTKKDYSKERPGYWKFQSSRRFRQIPTKMLLMKRLNHLVSFNRAGVSARFQLETFKLIVNTLLFQSSRRFRQIPTDVRALMRSLVLGFNRAGVSARFQPLWGTREEVLETVSIEPAFPPDSNYRMYGH